MSYYDFKSAESGIVICYFWAYFLDRYIDYKVENNIYTEQLGVEDGFNVDELERQFYKECPQEYNEMFDALQVKAEQIVIRKVR